MSKPEQLKLSDKVSGDTAGTCTIASWSERRRQVPQCHYSGKGSARLRRSTSFSRVKVRTTSGKNGIDLSTVGLFFFFGGTLADIYEPVEGHRDDSATTPDLTLSSLRLTTSPQCFIMLTRGRAQRFVLKAAEPEGLEACRLLFRRYEPVSTATTVSQCVDLLATTFSIRAKMITEMRGADLIFRNGKISNSMRFYFSN